MIMPKEREQVRSRITAACHHLILSQRMVELCEQEATPRQEDFLAYVLEQEILKREQNRKARQLSRAYFTDLLFHFHNLYYDPSGTGLFSTSWFS